MFRLTIKEWGMTEAQAQQIIERLTSIDTRLGKLESNVEDIVNYTGTSEEKIIALKKEIKEALAK